MEGVIKENNLTVEMVGQLTPLIFDNVQSGVVVLDPKFNIVCWNKIQEGFSRLPRDRVLGKNVLSLFPHLKENGIADDLQAALRGRCIQKPRVPYQREDGTIGYADRENTPLRDAEGKIIGILSFISDVTEKVKLEKSLLWAQKFEDLGQMAAGLAHELNNLFTILQCESELALDYSDLCAKDRIIAIAAKVAREGSGLTRQLLNFSRKPDNPYELADPKELVEGCARLLKGVLSGKNISLKIRMEEVPPIRINVSQIQQLIFNLVLNAKNAMKNGGVLKIGLNREPGRIKLTVSDNGPGIPPELIKKIFEPFITYSHGNTRLGTGLGLSICRDIVDNHQGTIEVRSRLGRGTKFEITLPTLPDRANEVSH